MSVEQQNAALVEAIRERQQRLTPLGYGIRTADDYLCGLIDVMEDEYLKSLPGITDLSKFSRETIIKDAENRLTYANDEMVYGDVKTGGTEIEEYCKAIGVDLPPRTLMTAELIVTTPRKDRDNDILLTEGAIVDPMMPALWHHMLAAPVGKMLKVMKHNSKQLKISAAVVDMPLGHDVAVLTEFGGLRISHGFRPLKYRRMEDKEAGDGPAGYIIEKFEMMEFSFVTVPSNPDACILAMSRGKLCDPFTKAWAKALDTKRPKTFASAVVKQKDSQFTEMRARIESIRTEIDSAKEMTPLETECMAACLECAAKCIDCVEACAAMPEMEKMRECCWRCISACETCARMIARHSMAACDVCAELCMQCAAACDAYQMSCCRECAQACRRCEQLCSGMMNEMMTADTTTQTKQGRVLSAANEKALRECLGMMDEACERMRGVLAKVGEGEPEKEASVADNAKTLIASLAKADESDVPLLKLCEERIAHALKQQEELEVERFFHHALSR